ncbi:carboxymuconolactone decarboxylase family protein [Cupriavidus sp. AcVe19-6a]|uniref:carboxymuconolactone decarboxylase family protein n=1 Tax=Cupriavidus sp. AcVe19-6a TaxID=2821358 RepID=UPI001AE451DD|nr:carboxymuconolactone decarboxylase family protein [Cupriavidus sp. AcVe19-6a]MBP0634232.1 carboxymuconolactone decarboxylase family protein [Cupriavidus sp. AcVe19-6a]
MSSETNSELQLSPTPLCDQLRATGNWNPAWDAFAELDPVWAEKFMVMGMHPVMSGVLEPKVLEFLAIAVDASCTHMYAPGTRRHIRKALELGATKEEIAAVLQAVSVLGIHTSSLGAPILLEELAALQREHAKGERAAA